MAREETEIEPQRGGAVSEEEIRAEELVEEEETSTAGNGVDKSGKKDQRTDNEIFHITSIPLASLSNMTSL